jgi:phosphate transport system protein
MGAVGQVGRDDDPYFEGVPPIRELRRSYHDRIADVREQSLGILRCAVGGVEEATSVLLSYPELLSPSDRGEARLPCDAAAVQSVAAGVDTEVVALLALEAPVARDLRVILAARDVTQVGLLCIGLSLTLAGRVHRAVESLTTDLRRLAAEVGTGTLSLLLQAQAAWAALDAGLASAVPESAGPVRTVQTEFITALISLGGVPMDAALDLAMVARAYERLADHGVEVAERVLFAVHGTPAPLLGPDAF